MKLLVRRRTGFVGDLLELACIECMNTSLRNS